MSWLSGGRGESQTSVFALFSAAAPEPELSWLQQTILPGSHFISMFDVCKDQKRRLCGCSVQHLNGDGKRLCKSDPAWLHSL